MRTKIFFLVEYSDFLHIPCSSNNSLAEQLSDLTLDQFHHQHPDLRSAIDPWLYDYYQMNLNLTCEDGQPTITVFLFFDDDAPRPADLPVDVWGEVRQLTDSEEGG